MFKPTKTNRVFKDVEEQIRNAIYRGKLKPEDKLPSERELVGKFRTSRVCIREALRSLELAGLIAVKRGFGGGAYITNVYHRPVSDSLTTLLKLGKISIADITEVRFLIEPTIARLAAERGTPEDLHTIRKTILDMEEIAKTGIIPDKFNLDFHRALAHATKNSVLILIMESFIDLLANTISYLRPDINTIAHVLKFHSLIFKAIEKKDGNKAAHVMSTHILDLQKTLKKKPIGLKRIQKNGARTRAK